MKSCTKCGVTKPRNQFSPRDRKWGYKDDRNSQCRDCVAAYNRERRASNPESQRQAGRRFVRKAKEANPILFTLKAIINSARARARQFSVPFNLTLEDFPNPPSCCPVLGIALDYGFKGKGGPKDNSPSIDRIIAGRGYISGNVVLISFRANRLRDNATAEELRKVAAYCDKIEVDTALRTPP